MTVTDIPPAFHIMAKSTGAACNLSCEYCFFLKKERLYSGGTFRMSDAVLEAYIRQLLEAHQEPAVTVAWQGGEPTLMGLDFFHRFAPAAKVGRKEPCPCGSGRKFKHCHGGAGNEPRAGRR